MLTGVEDDVIEEEDTIGDKSGIIREVVCILCVNGSAKYLLVWSLKFANLRTFSFVNTSTGRSEEDDVKKCKTR